MHLSIAAVMGRGLKVDTRVRYIFHHGVVPWGILVGLCAAVGVTIGMRSDPASATPATLTSIVVVASLSFVLWCCMAGWLIGSIRWEMRQTRRSGPLPRDHKRR